MAHRDRLKTWGHDSFMGREVFDDGNECAVSFNFSGDGSAACGLTDGSLRGLARELFLLKLSGKRVLLHESPGREEAHPSFDGSYVCSVRTYLPFTQEQMRVLQDSYSLYLSEFLNPFVKPTL